MYRWRNGGRLLCSREIAKAYGHGRSETRGPNASRWLANGCSRLEGSGYVSMSTGVRCSVGAPGLSLPSPDRPLPSFRFLYRASNVHNYKLIHSSSFSDLEKIAESLVEKTTGQSPPTCDAEDRKTSDSSSLQDSPPPSSFPFEGKTLKGTLRGMVAGVSPEGTKEQGGAAIEENGSYSVQRRDTKLGRFYHIVSRADKLVFDLPSVTTVLDSTASPSSFFSLRNWRRAQIKDLGEEGFRKMNAERLNIGVRFHKQLESRLLKNKTQVLSIKSRIENEPRPRANPSQSSPCALHKLSEHSVPYKVSSSEDEKEKQKAEANLSDKFGESTSGLEREKSQDAMAGVVVSTSKVGTETSDHETQTLDSTESGSQDRHTSKLLQSVQHVLDDITDVVALETVVTHLRLGYTGTCDCIAKYRGNLCVIDWKTSSKPRPSLSDCHDYPVQAAAYAGAVNEDSNYQFKVYNALIVVAYLTGEPADAHFLSQEQCVHAWSDWLNRLENYRTRFAHDLSNVYV